MIISILHILLGIIVALILIYTIRHYIFTISRLFGEQQNPYIDIDTANWPTVTVIIPAHNEENVIHHSLESLVHVNYPPEKLRIVPVDDRSRDRTGEIINDYAARYPNLVFPFHRESGKSGKAAVLKEASEKVTSDIIIIFDADYIPGRGLIKQLVAPFLDPEVGSVMGRVVPINTGHNLLTRLLDLERAGGYQVDQQARMNMGLLPQFGGTVGGVRVTALRSVDGWLDNTLAEDTDLTYRLALKGWKIVYQNRSECYEESPENWCVRVKQIARWAMGHNQSLFRYFFPVMFSRKIGAIPRIDGMLLLGVYLMSPLLLIGWIIAIVLFYAGDNTLMNGALSLLAVASYSALGNFAAFFQIGAATHLDRSGNRVRLLPLNFFNFLVSMLAISRATFNLIFNHKKPTPRWDKTDRFRPIRKAA